MVLNLEESVAVTQNFVSSVNLRHVLTFLRTQNPELVSGCRFDQRASLHHRFEQAMDIAHPKLMKQVSTTYTYICGPTTPHANSIFAPSSSSGVEPHGSIPLGGGRLVHHHRSAQSTGRVAKRSLDIWSMHEANTAHFAVCLGLALA
jgi:hypothetical protein